MNNDKELLARKEAEQRHGMVSVSDWQDHAEPPTFDDVRPPHRRAFGDDFDAVVSAADTMDGKALTHMVDRTSPKGAPFAGKCRLCGAEGLSLAAAREPCPNPGGSTVGQAIVSALAAPPAEQVTSLVRRGYLAELAAAGVPLAKAREIEARAFAARTADADGTKGNVVIDDVPTMGDWADDPVPRARPDMIDGTLTLLTPHAALVSVPVRVPALPSASPARTARALGAALTLALIRAATQYRDASGKELDLSTEKPAFTATFRAT